MYTCMCVCVCVSYLLVRCSSAQCGVHSESLDLVTLGKHGLDVSVTHTHTQGQPNPNPNPSL